MCLCVYVMCLCTHDIVSLVTSLTNVNMIMMYSCVRVSACACVDVCGRLRTSLSLYVFVCICLVCVQREGTADGRGKGKGLAVIPQGAFLLCALLFP